MQMPDALVDSTQASALARRRVGGRSPVDFAIYE